MVIDNGKAEARIDSAVYEASPSMRDTLHDELKSRFQGFLLSNRKPYDLSRPNMTRVEHADGRKESIMEVEPMQIVITGGKVDFQIRDKDGNIVADSERDRIEKERRFADLVSRYRAKDEVLAGLLNSYDDSLRYPDKGLVSLFEILEAMRIKFGGDKGVHSKLKISLEDLGYLGTLCNETPLRQGRHGGKKYEAKLRDATEDEISKAHRIAVAIIEAYLQRLSSTNAK